MSSAMRALIALSLRDACITAARHVRHDKVWTARLIGNARSHSRSYLSALRAAKAVRS